MLVPPFPRRVQVELTNYCNQRCRYCPRQGLSRPLGFMSRPLFERIAQECAAHGARMWLHFLGEPLLHRGVVEFCRYAKEAGVPEVGLSTNAVSLRGQVAEQLLQIGLDRLECSLDAADAATYQVMRGRDHFARVRDNLTAFFLRKRELGQQRPVVSLQVLLTPETRGMLALVVEHWRPLLTGADFVMTIEPSTFGGSVSVSRQLPDRERPPCRWLFEGLIVLQDGTVTMCGTDWDGRAPVGHAQAESLLEIWHGKEMQRRRAAHMAKRFTDVAPCASCVDWPLADGRGYRNVLRDGLSPLANGQAGALAPRVESSLESPYPM